MTPESHTNQHTKKKRASVATWISLWSIGIAVLIATGATNGSLHAQTTGSKLKLDTGEEIFKAGCVGCHGPDGSGATQELAGFERPPTFPNFTDCPTTTPEPDVQWRAQITNGGPARGFSQIMPAFGDLLTQDQITKVLQYLRSLCTEKSWPMGDLNFPRAFVTEKAFPEDEVVISSNFNIQNAPGGSITAFYEKRIGPSGMIEAQVPYSVTHDSAGTHSSFGDIALGYKRKLFSSVRTGSIFSAGGEIIAPTGKSNIGTGGNSTTFELFTAFDQRMPKDSFVQFHTGFELPIHPDKAPRAYYLRTAIGKTLSTDKGLGRRWTPMAEFIYDRDLVRGAPNHWDVIPELQIPLSKRLHILGAIGLDVPVNDTVNRPKQVMFYLLWDFVDGGLTEGWK